MTPGTLIRDRNSFDASVLEPGDVLMVANPTDVPALRYLLFWSHVGIVGLDGLVIDAVREPRGEWHGEPSWYHVQKGPVSSYLLSYDVLAVRPRLSSSARLAAAQYAESQVGAPYAGSVREILFGRRSTSGYSCASLMWQAYEQQGLNLAPAPRWLEYAAIPLAIAHDANVATVGKGTRYRPIPPSCRRLRLARHYYHDVLGANIIVEGTDDNQS